MVDWMIGAAAHTVLLETDGGSSLFNRIFGLDSQLGMDAVILALAVFFLFMLLSYLVFNPARELMKKRQARIQDTLDNAAKEKKDALAFKAEYDGKLRNADKEVDTILSEGRKKALKRENEIIEEANKEAKRIAERAEKEAELERNKMQDEFKKEMVSVAAAMAGKFVSSSLNEAKQTELVNEALNEMGDDTWRK